MHTDVENPSRDRPVDEIEVTPEMIEAGAEVIFSSRDDLMAWNLAAAVYRAMEQERIRLRMAEASSV